MRPAVLTCFVSLTLLTGVSSSFPGVMLASPAATADEARTQTGAPAQANQSESYGKLPLAFEANHGQMDGTIKFLARGSGYALFLTGSGATLALGGSNDSDDCKAGVERKAGAPEACAGRRDTVRMRLAGADSHAAVTGEAKLPGRVNYFLGNDPAKWQTGLPTYAKVRYSGVYPGVDLVYYGNRQQLEYDFVIAPGADPAQIQLKFEGESHVRITADGDLVLEGAYGSAVFHKPVAYQEHMGKRLAIAGKFQLSARNTVGFSLGSYDHARPLVIDPVLVYSTYLGGSGTLRQGGDRGNSIAVNAAGNTFIVGTTYSTNFPVTWTGYQLTNHGGCLQGSAATEGHKPLHDARRPGTGPDVWTYRLCQWTECECRFGYAHAEHCGNFKLTARPLHDHDRTRQLDCG